MVYGSDGVPMEHLPSATTIHHPAVDGSLPSSGGIADDPPTAGHHPSQYHYVAMGDPNAPTYATLESAANLPSSFGSLSYQDTYPAGYMA